MIVMIVMTAPLTDPLSLGIAAVAGVVALVIAWLQWPRPPALDGEAWFKLSLCTLIRGRMDAEGASAAAWEREVVRVVPYHPAGRLPERKLSNPAAAVLPGVALEGELALIEALARLQDPVSRATLLFDEDESGRAARFRDPDELGPSYRYERLGPGASWDALADWGRGERGFVEAAVRAVPARWVLLEGRPGRLVGPSVLDALASELAGVGPPHDRSGVVRVPWGDDSAEAAIRAAITEDDQRLVLVAEEAGVARALEALVDAADLRDQVAAVVSVGGVIGGRTDESGPLGEVARRDWLGAHFNHLDLDTEVVRMTPYFAVQWLDRAAWPPGAAGLPLQASRFPAPAADRTLVETVEVVDLGPLPSDRPIPVDLVARALIAVVLGWVRSRR
jgi:hypothetical protein